MQDLDRSRRSFLTYPAEREVMTMIFAYVHFVVFQLALLSSATQNKTYAVPNPMTTSQTVFLVIVTIAGLLSGLLSLYTIYQIWWLTAAIGRNLELFINVICMGLLIIVLAIMSAMILNAIILIGGYFPSVGSDDMNGRPDLRTMSEVGYKGAGFIPRVLLVATHLLLIPSIRTSYRIRNTLPWLCIALVSCFVASSAYHFCYSLDVCIFGDALMHRHCDYVTSLMLANILLLSRCWNRFEMREPIQQRQSFDRGGSRSMKTYVGVSIRCNPQQNELAIRSDAIESPVIFTDSGSAFTYPLRIKVFILFLYVINLYAHVRMGRNQYFTKITIYFTGLFVISHTIMTLVYYGLRVRVLPLVLVGLALGGAYTMYCVEANLGAMGHNLWHVFDFLAIHIYVHYGPLLAHGDDACIHFC